jgi:PilZ domain
MADSTPRFPFLASAEVATDDSVELTRVTELSRHGCYLETTKQRTAGTRVTVKIISEDKVFEATATVLYSRPTFSPFPSTLRRNHEWRMSITIHKPSTAALQSGSLRHH